MKRSFYHFLLTPWAVLLLLIGSFSPARAQICGDPESKAEVTLNSIGTVTVTGANGRTEAGNAYKKGLAAAADSAGLAACQNSCTIGECRMDFVKYVKGRTPRPTKVGETYVFPPPKGDSLVFEVDCPCFLDIYIDPDTLDGRPYQGGIGAAVETPVQGTELAGTAAHFYPNPARDELFVELNLSTLHADVHLRLIDLRGSLVQQRALGKLERGSHQFRVDLSGLASGIYFGLIEGEGLAPVKTRLVIQP
ncbi:MAG: T9SS type A sorting domain-containing protein [Bacteroidota bacterium]